MSRYSDDTKIMNSITNFKTKCKHCGHSITMPNAERTICSYCGYWVYRNKKIEFKYRMKEMLRKVKDDRE